MPVTPFNPLDFGKQLLQNVISRGVNRAVFGGGRGQSTFAPRQPQTRIPPFNIGGFLNTLTSGQGSIGGLPGSVFGGIQGLTGLTPQQQVGLGLVLASTRQREPGSITEARQFQRNLFTSPTALPNLVTQQVQGLTPFFEPEFNRVTRNVLEQVQQAEIAGMPQSLSTAMGGPERLALRNAAIDQLIPQQQAFLANLALENIGRQQRAAEVLFSERPTSDLGAALGTAGGLLLLPQRGGAQARRLPTAGALAAPVAGLGGVPGGVGGGGFPGAPAQTRMEFANAIADAFGGAIGTGNFQGSVLEQPISQLLGTQAAAIMRAGGTGDFAIFGPGGQIVGGLLSNGDVVSGTTGEIVGNIEGVAGAGGSAAGAGGFAASGLGGALAAAGAAAGGFFGGKAIGPKLPNQATGALAGAATGAATGAVIGSVVPGLGTAIGAIIGGIAGAAGGFFGKRGSQQEQKAIFRQQDNDSQKDQVFEIGNIGMTFLSRFGADPTTLNSFTSRVERLASTVESPRSEGELLAQELGRELTRILGGPPAKVAPELRQEFIDYMTTNTFTAGNSSFGGGAPRDLIRKWSRVAQLRHGGTMRRSGTALVGEAGPELVHLPRGSTVIPLVSSNN